MIKVGSPEFLFMAETEGETDLVDTRTARLNAVIREVRDYPGETVGENIFRALLAEYHLEDLSSSELSYIQDSL